MIKHKKFIFLFLLIFLHFFSALALSQQYLDYREEEVQKLLFKGIDACFRENYSLAEKIFSELVSEAPQDPAGYFFMAMFYQAQMTDYESDFREKEFYESIDLTQKYAKARIKNRKDAWGYLFLGNSYAAKAIYEARKGNWVSGLNSGLKAKSALNEAIQHDPELYDAYMTLGSYHYWASVVIPSWAGWLPFIGDRREEGIAELKLAQERSIFSKDAASNGLIWIYINEKNFNQAIDLAKQMQDKYSEGKSFLWALAAAYYEKKDWINALSSYQELLLRIERQVEEFISSGNHPQNPHNHYNHIECKFHIASCLFNLGKFDECILVCEEIQNYPLDEKTKNGQKEKLRSTKELLKEAGKCSGKAAEG